MELKTERNRMPFGFYFLLIFGSALIDQAVKLFVPGAFHNYQFAFSLPVPLPVMFAIYGVIVASVIIYLAKKFFVLDRPAQIAWCLILGGALSNIGERIVLGYVRDFIPLFGGILNLADLFILAGIAILLYQEIFHGLRSRRMDDSRPEL